MQLHSWVSGCQLVCRYGLGQWEAIGQDERLHLRDKLAAAATERVTKKARGRGEDSILPRGALSFVLQPPASRETDSFAACALPASVLVQPAGPMSEAHV